MDTIICPGTCEGIVCVALEDFKRPPRFSVCDECFLKIADHNAHPTVGTGGGTVDSS